MSLETWKKEFYPKEADKTTPEEALEHSLRKWQGLTPENRERHKVRTNTRGYLVEEDGSGVPMYISDKTCALCHHFYETYADFDPDDTCRCNVCPLALVRGGVPCDRETKEEHRKADVAPWASWISKERDPKPMIFWLQRAKDES